MWGEGQAVSTEFRPEAAEDVGFHARAGTNETVCNLRAAAGERMRKSAWTSGGAVAGSLALC
jgi:hypothetical protein